MISSTKTKPYMEKFQDDYKQYLTEKGEYFGYPKCCVDQFVEDIINCNKISDLRENAGQGTGFIPCDEHANLVVNCGKPLKSLINGRACPTAFPHEDSYTK